MNKVCYRIIKLNFVGIIGFLNLGPVSGDAYRAECRIEFRSGSGESERAQEIFTAYPNVEAIEICDIYGSDSEYYVLSDIINDSGVYYYSRERIIRREIDDDVVWETMDSSVVKFMRLKKNGDPVYGDPSFVAIEGVDGNEYSQILTTWKEIVSNETARYKIFRNFSIFWRIHKEVRSLDQALAVNDEIFVHSLIKPDSSLNKEAEYHLIVGNSSNSWRIKFAIRNGKVLILNIAAGLSG